MTCATSKYSDQHPYSPSLVFVRTVESQRSKPSSSWQQRIRANYKVVRCYIILRCVLVYFVFRDRHEFTIAKVCPNVLNSNQNNTKFTLTIFFINYVQVRDVRDMLFTTQTEILHALVMNLICIIEFVELTKLTRRARQTMQNMDKKQSRNHI